MADKMWGGRFKKKLDADFESFSASLSTDCRLLPYDLRIDAAHVSALRGCGVLNASESKKLLSAIASLEKELSLGRLRLGANEEDVHSAVHSLLKARVGELADKLHTGRSRNDLVSQSSRLYCKDHARHLVSQLTELQRAFVDKASQTTDTLLPGMTHLQNAQVLSQAHIFLAYVEMLDRAKLSIAESAYLSDVCVLGSGALAGTTFDLDQKKIARQLQLSRVTRNSYDVSGDRDFIFAMSYGIFHAGLALSRIAEDLMIAQTKGFLLADIDQAFCTGSSMMPQKKNADFVELTRGASSIFGANVMGLGLLLKGLPTSYNRDLQWDKTFLFDSVETCEELLTIFIKMARTLKIDKARAAGLLKDETLYATDLADYLVQKGTSFKKAHEQVGALVRFAEESGVSLSAIGLDIYQRFAPRAQGDVYDLFDAEHSVRLKRTEGSTHPAQVKKQITYWKKELRRA